MILTRVLLGGCDLILAAGMYWLFTLMDGGRPAHMISWLPRSILSAAGYNVAIVLTRMLLDLVSLHAIVRYMQSLNQKFLIGLMQGYSEMRWDYVVQRNRSEMLKHATVTAQDAAYSYQMFVELVAESVVLLLFAIALISASPGLAASVSGFVLLLYLVHRFLLRHKSSLASVQRDNARLSLQRFGSEFLALGKEIRTYRNQEFFLKRISREAEQLGDAQVMVGVLPQIPRMLVDQGIAVLFLAIIITVQLRHGNARHLFALLVYYFVISQRLLPLISHVVMILGQTEGAVTTVQTIRTELDKCARHRTPESRPPGAPMGLVLQLHNVSFAYEASAPIFENVQLSMRAGEIVLLHGPSGAGKSSLLNLIAGVSVPTNGIVAIDPGRVAYVPQEVTLLDDTIRKNMLFGLGEVEESALLTALRLVRLNAMVESLPAGVETRVGDNGILFSGGQRQRMGIARALLRNAKLILLDEATSALDEKLEQEILTSLSAAGIALLLVSHRSQNRRFAHRVLSLGTEGLLLETEAAMLP